MLTRRDMLSGMMAAGAAPLLGGAAMAQLPAPEPMLFAASRMEPDGSYAAVLFTETGDRKRVSLPARGHDLTFRPQSRECVVFARRPGTFAGVFTDDSRDPLWFKAGEGRHFDGHGVFSSDGRLLYSTENDYTGDESRGVIGVRDPAAAYRQIGEFASGGMDPHDMALLSDGRTLVVANGGIELDPETGRIPLNLTTMEPALVYIDCATGDVVERHVLDKSLHKLSIRHLAVVANDLVVFGCQYEGPAADFPPLIGFHRRCDTPVLVEAPAVVHRDLKNYIGSVAADASGTIIAASAPKGGLMTFWDVESRRYLGEKRLIDGCGISSTQAAGDFMLTSGGGQVLEHSPVQGFGRALDAASWHGASWDNHVVRL